MADLRSVITSHDAVEFLRWLDQRRPVLAVDTETTGLDWKRDTLQVVSFGDAQTGWAVPASTWLALALEAVTQYDRPMCLHNHKFDSHFIYEAGVRAKIWARVPPGRHCTMTMARINRPDRRVALKQLATQMQHPLAEFGSVFETELKARGLDWHTVDATDPDLLKYAAADAVITAAVYEHEQAALDTDVYKLEMSAQMQVERMEAKGVPIDWEYLDMLSNTLEFNIKRTIEEARAVGVDLRSRSQVLQSLLDAGWEPSVLTPKGQPSLSSDALEGVDLPIARAYTELKTLEKKKSTWVDDLLARNFGDRVYPSINCCGTVTGRMSVTSPALQTLPRTAEIRNAFYPAPILGEPRKLIACDYAQQELRIIAALTRDPHLTDALKSEDVHTAVATQLFGRSDISLEERHMAKTSVFAIVYGAGAAKLAQALNTSQPRAEQLIDQFKARFPAATGAVQLMSSAASAMPPRHMALKTPFGRLQVVENDKPHILVNHMVQGTGADVLKSALDRISRSHLAEHAILPIHDEILFEVAADEAEQAARDIEQIMTDERFEPRLPAEAQIMDRWGDKYG